jgi:uncharacterized membrane protein
MIKTMPEDKEQVTSADVSIERLGRNGYLHRIIPIVDKAGNVVQRVVKPLSVEFRWRDLLQVVVGASILAIPAAYTEETWDLGSQLAAANIIGIAIMSVLFIATFVYFNFYKSYFEQFWGHFLVRVIATYLLSLVVVAILLALIDKTPWGVDNVLAIKRIIVVGFPAAMSATVADALK